MKRSFWKNFKTGKNFFPKLFLVAAAVFLAGGIIFGWFHARPVVAGKFFARGNFYFNGGAYDLEKAEKWYKWAIKVNEKISGVHYQLARVYFVGEKLGEAKKEIDREIALFPQNKRSFYIRGLIDGYAKNYSEAISDFKKFIEWSPKEWAGYNDLAWVYYESGDYENAKAAAEKGLEVAPGNPWLLNSLGVSYSSLGNFQEAEKILEEASQTAGKLTAAEWHRAYPGNNPASAEWDLAKFKGDTRLNLSLAGSGSSKKGLIVSACYSSCESSCIGCNMRTTCLTCGGPEGQCVNNVVSEIFSSVCCPPAPPCPNGACDNGETCDTCPADCGACPIDGQCGTANGQNFCSGTVLSGGQLCSSGSASPSSVTVSGSVSWTCQGQNGGSSASCSAGQSATADGQCGASSGGFYCAQSEILAPCDAGTASAITLSGSTWTWTCSGQCGGATSNECSATKSTAFDGSCGTADGKTYCNDFGPSVVERCSPAGSSAINFTYKGIYGGWTWNCAGQCGGTTSDECSAKGKGACGWIETNP